MICYITIVDCHVHTVANEEWSLSHPMILLQVCFVQLSLRKHVRNRFPFFIHHMLISLRRCHYATIAVYVVRSRCSNMIGMIDLIIYMLQ